MTRLTAILCGWIALQAVAMYVLYRSAKDEYQDGLKEGYQRGYAQGHKDADGWWIGTEDAVADRREAS